MFIITDGSPTDNGWELSATKAVKAETSGKVVIFPIGTEGADFDNLNQFSSREAMMLQNLNFKELFVWLSQSVSAGSQTAVDTNAQLPANWGIVPS